MGIRDVLRKLFGDCGGGRPRPTPDRPVVAPTPVEPPSESVGPDTPTQPPSPPASPPSFSGTEIVALLAPTLCPEREAQIAEFALSGDVPQFLRSWVEVTSEIPGHQAVLWVLPDFFALGSDEDFVRVPMNPITAQRIGDSFDACLPTRKIVNLLQEQAACKIPADPWGPPYDASMLTTQRFAEHNERIEVKRAKLGCQLGVLASGHKKDVVIGKGLEKTSTHVGIYGWFTGASVSTVIQGPTVNFSSHEITYADYSHGIRFVRRNMRLDGTMVNLDDVLGDPTLCALVSDEGPLTKTRYG